MFPRVVLQILVFALALLLVSFGVVMGSYALAQGLQDAVSARVLFGVGMGLLILLAIDGLLLLAALGIDAIARGEGPRLPDDE